jgi:peptide/nickel transport system permease protein
MKRNRRLTRCLICLAVVHLLVLLAEFFAPYEVTMQDRELPYSAPTSIHWLDKKGRLSRPFVYLSVERAGDREHYTEDHRTSYPIRMFPCGARYTIASMATWNCHLFGVDPPARIFLMGTDAFGRDLFSRVLVGGRVSLFSGIAATILSLTIGVSLGIVSGLYEGWQGAIIMRCVELFLAVPWRYLLLALRGLLPLQANAEKSFLMFVVVIGVIGWARPARLVRGIVLSVKQRRHLLAARSFGASNFYLVQCHILPELSGLVLTQAAVSVPQYVVAEVALSFFGVGVGEPSPSWGGMLASLQQYHVLASKWWMFLPGLMLIPVMLTYGLLATSLQDSGAAVRSWMR